MEIQRLALLWTAATWLMLGAILLAVALVAPAHAQDGATATVVVHVLDVSPQGGVLRLGLYDEARYPDDDSTPVASADVQAQSGETVITLRNVPPGTYAIETFQDLNSDNKMNTSWFGFPLEPFGFSRDARPHLSKPRFSAVKFEVTPGLNVQSVHLQTGVSLIAAR